MNDHIVQDFFHQISESKEIDITEVNRWGFYFLDSDKVKLIELGKELEKRGFEFIQIFEAEKIETNDASEFYMHVERSEIHTVNTLLERNEELKRLTLQFDVSEYDGFDVGVND